MPYFLSILLISALFSETLIIDGVKPRHCSVCTTQVCVSCPLFEMQINRRFVDLVKSIDSWRTAGGGLPPFQLSCAARGESRAVRRRRGKVDVTVGRNHTRVKLNQASAARPEPAWPCSSCLFRIKEEHRCYEGEVAEAQQRLLEGHSARSVKNSGWIFSQR